MTNANISNPFVPRENIVRADRVGVLALLRSARGREVFFSRGTAAEAAAQLEAEGDVTVRPIVRRGKTGVMVRWIGGQR